MRKKDLITIMVALMLLFSAITAVFYSVGYLAQTSNNERSNRVTDITIFTNNSVCLLGSSQDTKEIIETLHQCTSNLSVIDDAKELSSVGQRTMLFIDGSWLMDQDSKGITEAVAPLILQGTPVVILNGSPDILISITEENGIGVLFGYPSENFSIHLNPGHTQAGSLCLGEGDLVTTVVMMYNWCVSAIARM